MMFCSGPHCPIGYAMVLRPCHGHVDHATGSISIVTHGYNQCGPSQALLGASTHQRTLGLQPHSVSSSSIRQGLQPQDVHKGYNLMWAHTGYNHHVILSSSSCHIGYNHMDESSRDTTTRDDKLQQDGLPLQSIRRVQARCGMWNLRSLI